MKPGQKGFLSKVWYTITMAPYKRIPRRYFTDQMFNPYFNTNHYHEEHTGAERSIEKGFSAFMKYIKKISRKK
jgi:hypothetical protein